MPDVSRAALAPRLLAEPLTADQRAQLGRWARGATTPQRVARRSRIVLLAADGLRVADVARKAGVSLPTVRLWVRRFEEGGPEALLRDAPGRGRQPRPETEALRAMLLSANGEGAAVRGRSVRELAKEFGVSPSSAWRVLRKTGA